ncbi:hypothetical protein pEaSNUABM29_00014 [Erwinia phage pEa_SNUABM_29]|nr:hypothetical protein pEaSNUABM29_00014 [Erwinia phage pEa_SNUABM_29]
MLKPRKCRKAMVILSPRVSIAVGKKLVCVKPEDVKEEFMLFSNASSGFGKRAQECGMIGKSLGGWYLRFMKRNYPDAKPPQFVASSLVAGLLATPARNLSLKAEYRFDEFVPNKSLKHYIPLESAKEAEGVHLVGK